MKKNNHIHASNLMSEVVSTATLEAAFCAVCAARRNASANDDIWSTRLYWPQVRGHLQKHLLSGEYQLSPVSLFRTKKGYFTRWSAEDAIILKAIALTLAPLVSEEVGFACHHLRGHGGLKAAVRRVDSGLSKFRYVIKSDVKQFYESMNHERVIRHCQALIKDKRILAIIAQYLNRCEVFQGDHRLIEQGIPKGCPLSPLMGALMLKSLDACVPKDAFYARYMDDWVILVKTRAQCRRMVKKMHRVMHRLKFKLALDKTFIGKISKGFDFLGYRFNHLGLIGLAKKTIQNFLERIAVLYEQGASDLQIQQYIRRWIRWCDSGI